MPWKNLLKFFDKSLETINIYYHKRCVEDIVIYGLVTEHEWSEIISGNKNEKDDEKKRICI